MPTVFAHQRATRAALAALMACDGADEALAHRLGLRSDAALALCWWQQPLGGPAPDGAAFTLGFDDSCAGRRLPRQLRSALDGTPLPVRAVRGGRHGQAHAWVRTENHSHQFLHGTLTAVLRRTAQPSRLLALTSGHVLAAAPDSRRDDAVTFWFDQEPEMPLISGRLQDWQPNFQALPTAGEIDAALVEVSADALAPLAGRTEDWPVGTAAPLADDRLFLRTRGLAIGGGQPHLFGARLCVNGDLSRPYQLDGALCWSPDQASEAGDSGAPVWNSLNELVGVHAGAAPDGVGQRCAVAVPIAPVLAWAGAQLVRRHEPLVRTAPAFVAPAAAAAPAATATATAAQAADANAVMTLARTMWGEARGERGEVDGMDAVAHVVLNRVRRATYWGHGVVEVCQKPWQFSCWNRNDPNLAQLLRVDATQPRFARALASAQALITQAQQDPDRRARADPTLGATHYYAARLSQPPRWAVGHAPCARIGAHLFFNDIA